MCGPEGPVPPITNAFIARAPVLIVSPIMRHATGRSHPFS
jgi:hypothetical protein